MVWRITSPPMGNDVVFALDGDDIIEISVGNVVVDR